MQDNTKLSDAVKAIIVRGLTAQRAGTAFAEATGDGMSEVMVTVEQIQSDTIELAHDEVSGISFVWELTVSSTAGLLAPATLVGEFVREWYGANPS